LISFLRFLLLELRGVLDGWMANMLAASSPLLVDWVKSASTSLNVDVLFGLDWTCTALICEAISETSYFISVDRSFLLSSLDAPIISPGTNTRDLSIAMEFI